jgi:ATP-dependent helicase HrpA
MADARIDELKKLLPLCLLPDWVRLGRRLIRILQDRHYPSQRDALLERLLERVHASIALREQRRLNVPQVSFPPDLPIMGRKEEILAAIRAHQTVVIAGETGSGKTTQLPKMCLEAGLGIEAKIGCTQPRRVAALSISRRIAEELNVAWGREVGCKIRFDDRSSPETYIKLMTDGILLAEMQSDPELSEYNAIILDEAHERSLNIDFLLGHLKGLLGRRQDLKLIITSATIDTQLFSRHFDDAPVIEISGRLYPVEVQYRPLDSESEERGEVSYVDAAILAAERILYETNTGDMLIFMPGERDIRETGDQLEGRISGGAEVIPLFGRLSSGDQQRVFAPCSRRKIVIATNIAETSLTIPGIRYVIDAGLARVSRYNPRTRIRRLPIEPVSQSSANQRMGRAGRMRDGMCIRLYSEQDFNERPQFTQPEIQRANLAEVILRMKAFHLGDVETFPFVQPPAPNAIATGYALLQELGALDERRELTRLGEDLARLPIDPTLGRMLLQSQREHATRELLIIAAGLSVQDPRERPLDQKEAAAAAHRQFADPRSDFLSLLNIWNAVHDEWDGLRTQNQRRKFCRKHFLSYSRMREWQDVYAQLHDALDGLGTLRLNESNADYDAVHRSILAGLIGHVARFEERNSYKGAGNRTVAVFPGSVLYARGEPVKKAARKGDKAGPKPQSNQPAWIVAGEIVETSQLFARTLGGINPEWIYQLAPHCCKLAHQNPRWDAHAGNVLVDEIITLHGLEVQRRKVAYGNINPKDATAIFIRSALVEERLLPDPGPRGDEAEADRDDIRVLTALPEKKPTLPPQYRFLTLNQAVRQKIENWRTRVRSYHLGDLDQVLGEFYARHIEAVSSIHDLNRLLREPGTQERLCISEAELTGGHRLEFDSEAFPDAVPINGQPVALAYAYAPGEEHDGVTVNLPFSLVQTVSPALIEWAVPGLRHQIVSELLRALPKAIRKELMPFPPKVEQIVAEFQPSKGSFVQGLADFILERYRVKVPLSAWPTDALPAHLRPRVDVLDGQHKSVGSGRDLGELQQRLKPVKSEPTTPTHQAEWTRAAQQWERFGLTDWTFGNLPARLTISEGPGLPLYAWPGLEHMDGEVNVRLFRDVELAQIASLRGVQRLVELAIQKDIAWLEKDLHALSRYDALYAPLGDSAELRASSLEHLKRYSLPAEPLPALSRKEFDAAVANARARLPGLAFKFMDQLEAILQLRLQVQKRISAEATVASPRPRTLSSLSQLGAQAGAASGSQAALLAELGQLVPPRFLERIPYERLPHLARYLKALLVRAERASLNPAKDQERVRQLTPYVEALKELEARRVRGVEARREVEAYRWMVEEYKVSLFAQESWHSRSGFAAAPRPATGAGTYCSRAAPHLALRLCRISLLPSGSLTMAKRHTGVSIASMCTATPWAFSRESSASTSSTSNPT